MHDRCMMFAIEWLEDEVSVTCSNTAVRIKTHECMMCISAFAQLAMLADGHPRPSK